VPARSIVRDLETIPRADFIAHYWDHQPDNHMTIVGPSRCGKSRLVWDLLDVTATPQLPALYLLKKPKDELILTRARAAGFRRTETWPAPMLRRFQSKPPGWLIHPPTHIDIHDPISIDRSNLNKARVFRMALLESYKRGNRIVVADDAFGLSKQLGLENEIVELLTESAAMDCGLWLPFQRAAGVPLAAYSMAVKLILFREPDKRGRDRFGEISGVDPDLVRWANMRLKKYQALYIDGSGPFMCVIDRS